MARHNPNNRSSKESFAGIPRIVMDSSSYLMLGPSAKALLFEAAYQYKGNNNGNLCFAWTLMQNRGWKSKATLDKAIKELVKEDFIILSRRGHFRKPFDRCSLYAITWKAIDECPGKNLELGPTNTPPRKFSVERANENRKQST
tara:strand:- start:11702 stop:12133 length:432 start_codon:yes stop_codon:yes gene_type:complete